MKRLVHVSVMMAIFLLLIKNVAAQSYENLVFEGGGVRGIAYCGALSVLEEKGIIKNLKRVAGTSAGAIQAALISLNYSSAEITAIISEMNVKQFNDGQMIFFGGSHRLRKNFGWYKGDVFLKWMESLIEKKTGNKHLTFKQLHDLAQRDRSYKDLYITATNLTKQRAELLSYERFPDMKISDAVRISISIPLYYRAAFIDSVHQVSYKPKAGINYEILVDGGILDNYPIHTFDRKKYVDQNDTSSDITVNRATLGIRLDSEEQIRYDSANLGLAPINITGFKSYLLAFYNIIIENLNRQKLTSDDWKRTISVSTENIGPRVKRTSAKSKEILIQSGKRSAEAFLTQTSTR
jgi:NTE family protein